MLKNHNEWHFDYFALTIYKTIPSATRRYQRSILFRILRVWGLNPHTDFKNEDYFYFKIMKSEKYGITIADKGKNGFQITFYSTYFLYFQKQGYPLILKLFKLCRQRGWKFRENRLDLCIDIIHKDPDIFNLKNRFSFSKQSTKWTNSPFNFYGATNSYNDWRCGNTQLKFVCYDKRKELELKRNLDKIELYLTQYKFIPKNLMRFEIRFVDSLEKFDLNKPEMLLIKTIKNWILKNKKLLKRNQSPSFLFEKLLS